MQIILNTTVMSLEEPPLDIGYASEKVRLSTQEGQERFIGGQNGKTQILIGAPFVDEAFIEELQGIAAILPKGGDYPVEAALIVAHAAHTLIAIEGFETLIDSEGEFGDFYGVRIKNGPCGGELAKALFLISKDGAIFYEEIPSNLLERFNLETLERKIFAAQSCYTGKGCH
ncbi:MAG: hypothetical protein JXK05_14465 [Campylobacterales bacterium]|nr:hypothetical protein [Campylobacterales bacterium]